MKKIKPKLCFYILILLLCFLFFLFLYTKTNKEIIETQEINNHVETMISNTQISEFVFSQQNADGGFSVAIPNINSDLSDTYYAIDSLSLINKNTDYSNAEQFIKMIDMKMLLDKNNIYSLKNCYYYLGLCDLLNISIDKSELKQIIRYVSSLMTDEGYFYNTNSEEKKASKDYLLDSYYLEALMFGHKILSSYKNEVNTVKLQEDILKCIDFNDYSSKMCALLSTYLEISILYDYDNAKYKEKLETFLSYYTNSSIQENIGNMNDIFAVAKYINYNISDKIVNSVDLLWKLNGYSIDKNSEDVNIKATNQVLHILKELNINLNEKKIEQLYKFIDNGKKYTGSYTFTNRESELFSSYYAVEILELLRDSKESDLYNIAEFLDYKKNDFDNLPTSEQLFYLKISKNLNYDISKGNNDYFDMQFKILKEVDIVNNAELIILLLEIAEMYNYKVPQDVQTLIIERLNQYDKGVDNEMAKFINDCNIIYIKLLLQEQVEEKEITNLVVKFEQNIENWDDMLFAFQKIFKIADLKKEDDYFSDNIISFLLIEIDSKKKNGVYRYSSCDVSTFDSVYELLKIVTFYF